MWTLIITVMLISDSGGVAVDQLKVNEFANQNACLYAMRQYRGSESHREIDIAFNVSRKVVVSKQAECVRAQE